MLHCSGDASLQLAELKDNAGSSGIIYTKLCQIVLIFLTPLSSVNSAHLNSIKCQTVLWVEQRLGPQADAEVHNNLVGGKKMTRETLNKKITRCTRIMFYKKQAKNALDFLQDKIKQRNKKIN